MTYYPNPTGINGVEGLFIYCNTVTGGLAVPVFVLVFWMIIFLIPKNYNYPTVPCFGTASFICAIVSMLFNARGLIAPEITYAFIIMTAISGMIMWLEGK